MPAPNAHINANNLSLPVMPTYTVGVDRGTQATTIAAAGNLSAAVDLGHGMNAVGIIVGGTWTAAAITFQVSTDNVTFYNLYDSAGEFTIASAQVGTNRAISIDPTKLNGYRYLKVRSGTSATPVAQAAQASLTVVSIGR